MLIQAPAKAEADYNLCGVGVRVCGGPSVLANIDRRLKLLRCDDALSGLQLTFDFAVTDVQRPSVAPRPVYDPDAGEVVYDDATDELFLSVGSGVRALCTPASGATFIEAGDGSAHADWLLSHAALTLPLIEQLKRRGLYSLHAAGVSRGGRGLIIAGASGSGKSTLAVALARAGFDFLSDDMLFLSVRQRSMIVHGFADEVDVTESTVSFFPELQPVLDQPRLAGWPKRSFRPEALLPTRIVSTCVPWALVFPLISPSGLSEVRPISAQEALLELAPNVLLTEPSASQAHLNALAQLANRTPCYRLTTGRDFDALADQLGSLLV